jgi:uncharacterized membrane protein
MAWAAVAMIALVAAGGAAGGDEATSAEARAADQAFFETRIRPLLHDHCLECHAAGAEGGRVCGDTRPVGVRDDER